MMRSIMATTACILLAACGATGSPEATAGGDNRVDLRHLVETDVAGTGTERLPVAGVTIPTPSDRESTYQLLRQRKTLAGTTIAILRQQRGERVAYARAELDCGRDLFHVVGVADTRAHIETDVAHDGPLRPTAGLPLRQELSRFICARGAA